MNLSPAHRTAVRLRRPAAFTLVEMIVIVVILGLLAAIGAFAYNQVTESSRKHAARMMAVHYGQDASGISANHQAPVSALHADPDNPLDDVDNADAHGSDIIVEYGAPGADGAIVVGVTYGKYCTPVLFTTDVGRYSLGKTVKATHCVVDGGVLPDPTTPSTGTGPSVTATVNSSTGAVDVSWSAVSGAAGGYAVCTDGACSTGQPGYVKTSATTATLTGLAAGTHSVTVSALDAGGATVQTSDPVSVTVPAATTGAFETVASGAPFSSAGGGASIIGNRMFFAHYLNNLQSDYWTFDLTTKQWTQITGRPTTNQFNYQTASADGKAQAAIGTDWYILGGKSSNSPYYTTKVDILDTTTMTWRSGPAMPYAVDNAAVTEVGHKIYVYGGHTATFVNSSLVDQSASRHLQVLDTDTGVWSVLADAPSSATNPGAEPTMAEINGQLVVTVRGGGGQASYDVRDGLLVYNIASNSWTVKSGIRDNDTLYSDGASVAVGGMYWLTPVPPPNQATGLTEVPLSIYNPSTDAWYAGPHPDAVLTGCECANVSSGYLYVLGKDNTTAAPIVQRLALPHAPGTQYAAWPLYQ